MQIPRRPTAIFTALLLTFVLWAPQSFGQSTDRVLGAVESDSLEIHPAIQSFLESCRQGELYTPEQASLAARVAGDIAADAYSSDSAITEALREIYPDYGKALFAFASEELDTAHTALTEFAKSEDPFLAADSKFFLARLWMLEEQFEQALPVWKQLAGEGADWTPYSGQALFFRGVAESGLLLRPEAAATLEQFLDENPLAPERLRTSAIRQLDLLNRIETGSLADVQYQMEFSRRRLALRDAGLQTQETQTRIVEMLTKLIDDAEKKESQNQGNGQQCQKCQGKGCQQCQGQGKAAAGSKGNSPGSGRDDRGPDGRPGAEPRQQAWNHLRDKQREAKAFAAIKARFPHRYEELVKQYYESLQAAAENDE